MPLTITPTPHSTIDQALALTITSSPSITAALSIFRVHPDGSTHRIPTATPPGLVSGSWSGTDRHAPFNQFFTYSASAGVQTGVSAEQYLHSDHVFLFAPMDSALTVKVDRIRSLKDGGLVSRAVRLDIVNAPQPTHRHDSPMSTTGGELVVQVETPEQYVALKKLVKEDDPFLINTPYNDFEIRWQWAQPKGITPVPIGRSPWYPLRDIVIPFELTAQPV